MNTLKQVIECVPKYKKFVLDEEGLNIESEMTEEHEIMLKKMRLTLTKKIKNHKTLYNCLRFQKTITSGTLDLLICCDELNDITVKETPSPVDQQSLAMLQTPPKGGAQQSPIRDISINKYKKDHKVKSETPICNNTCKFHDSKSKRYNGEILFGKKIYSMIPLDITTPKDKKSNNVSWKESKKLSKKINRCGDIYYVVYDNLDGTNVTSSCVYPYTWNGRWEFGERGIFDGIFKYGIPVTGRFDFKDFINGICYTGTMIDYVPIDGKGTITIECDIDKVLFKTIYEDKLLQEGVASNPYQFHSPLTQSKEVKPFALIPMLQDEEPPSKNKKININGMNKTINRVKRSRNKTLANTLKGQSLIKEDNNEKYYDRLNNELKHITGVWCDSELVESEEGIVEYEDGAIFYGKFKNKEPVNGIAIFPDGHEEEGEWDGIYLTKGIKRIPGPIELPKQTPIVGIVPNLLDGPFPRIEIGEYKDGQMTLGKIWYNNNKYIQGRFLYGYLVLGSVNDNICIKEGIWNDRSLITGTIKYQSGVILEGKFRSEQYGNKYFLVVGRKRLIDGMILQGEFDEQERLIYGLEISSTGLTIHGSWKYKRSENGEIQSIGNVIIKEKSGWRFNGTIINHKFHHGVLYNNVLRKIYRNGKVVSEFNEID